MAKAMGPFRDSRAPSWLSGPRTDAPVPYDKNEDTKGYPEAVVPKKKYKKDKQRLTKYY